MNKYMQENVLPNLKTVYFSTNGNGEEPFKTSLFGGGYIYLNKTDIEDIEIELGVKRTRGHDTEKFYNVHLYIMKDNRTQDEKTEKILINISGIKAPAFLREIGDLGIRSRPTRSNSIEVIGNHDQLAQAESIAAKYGGRIDTQMQRRDKTAKREQKESELGGKINTNFKFKNNRII